MVGQSDETLDSLDCELLVESGGAQVGIWRPILKEYEALEDQQKGRFKRIMEMWCVGQKLPSTMFNGSEGRTKAENLMLQAFKAFKIRLYGFVRRVGQTNTFIIIDLDPAKKQDKADPGILKRAKGRADEIGKGKKK